MPINCTTLGEFLGIFNESNLMLYLPVVAVALQTIACKIPFCHSVTEHLVNWNAT